MATTFSCVHTTQPFTCSATQPRKPDPARKQNNWWAPLFGWSSEPDYITTTNNNSSLRIDSGQENNISRPEKVTFRGCFTEEKAKELRKKTAESSTFHDIMYHSSIASRLASDVSGELGR